ncbi:MAG: DUF1552 domain-containing protein [Planctomycetota bacterium]|nr:MAG: DUF1552 domain-containing protein [Planctomycetota bacterium]REJ96129.1 MAG: DUF1552 domain-containing protein [Planctomycetota bacterium]REK22746.1 MAG: DUF1552 domain-containing protein [Planctomycetota bacterium]REK33834.1 MAG: DUF1552 domain-containing protein [Planctomycetota bacterium]
MQLPRRTVLKGIGAGLALPFLEAMAPRAGFAAGGEAPRRMAFVFFPNGVIMPHWKPTEAGVEYTLPKTLAPLAAHQKDLLVVSGLAHDKARANGDGAGDHARSCAAFLTGAQPRKTSGADIQAGQSVDQVAAEQVGSQTRLPSLELGIEAGRQAGSCDSGYSCAYSSNISWKSATTPMAKEINPKAAFERLFGTGVEDARARAERDFYRKSILDFVAEDANRLRGRLGRNDRRKLDEYFSSVREIETRIVRAEEETQASLPDMAPPEGIPVELTEHIRLMYDLMTVAFQSDTTRIATFMLANEGSNRSYREVDVKEGHHQLSHHRDDEEKMASLQRIDQYLVEQFAYFLERLKSIPEGDGTLLDNCMITYGCAISDGNRHNHDDLPVLVAGGGGGSITTGRHLQFESETPMNNLFLSLLDRMGVQIDSLGDSTSRLDGLTV